MMGSYMREEISFGGSCTTETKTAMEASRQRLKTQFAAENLDKQDIIQSKKINSILIWAKTAQKTVEPENSSAKIPRNGSLQAVCKNLSCCAPEITLHGLVCNYRHLSVITVD